MKLIIGGYAQGKSKYGEARFPGHILYDEANFSLLYREAPGTGIRINHLHRIIREKLEAGQTEEEILQEVEGIARNHPDCVFISDEIGSGIVPMDPLDRRWREVTGRILIQIAAESDEVIRLFCGIPQVIKKELPAVRHIFLIRHGATPGNLEHRYIGRTDESLSETGRREIERHCYPICDAVFCSPMRRCRETAELIHPARIPVEVADFRETDFGRFEGHTYQELQDDPAYRHWLRTEGTIPFPDGESREEVRERVLEGWQKMLKEAADRENIALVIHGGTIMTLLSELFGGNYYDYQVRNGEGYSFDVSWDGICSGLRARSYSGGSGDLEPSGAANR